jgi:hypothetical protein
MLGGGVEGGRLTTGCCVVSTAQPSEGLTDNLHIAAAAPGWSPGC